MNKLIIASAGSGKTTFIVNDAIDKASQGIRVLITTFTEACEQEIRDRIVEKKGCIPDKIIVQTWFSFLISHGVKPFQGCLFEYDVKGMLLVNGKSGFRFDSKQGFPVYWGEDNFDKFYFTDSKKIYSDKLAKLTIRCQAASNGMVFDRISRCFKWIYVDEIQDLAGYDLEVLDCLFKSNADVLLVGDPRQATYTTNNSRKNKKYVKSEIVNFFEDSQLDIETDTTSLTVNHRCFESICNFSNKLYPDLPQATSGNSKITGHDGVFALPIEHVNEYLSKFNPIQLRDSSKTPVSDDFEVLNFGKSKGLSLDRVVIYPSGPMVNWLKDNGAVLTQAARSKLYVALTRARNSVAIVLKKSDAEKISGIAVYSPS
jgi:DNA helicase-2/ATP-dependent DNA helicase PcrA